MRKFFITVLLGTTLSIGFAADKTPQFNDYAVTEVYSGKNHSLVMDSFAKNFKTRLKEAIKNGKPTFAGHYIVTGWGCGGGCSTGAIIDAITGRAYAFPVALMSVFPLKPEFEQENGQEHLYKLNSRLMVFAGNLEESGEGHGSDTIEFYEFKNDRFIFLKSMPYGRGAKQ